MLSVSLGGDVATWEGAIPAATPGVLKCGQARKAMC